MNWRRFFSRRVSLQTISIIPTRSGVVRIDQWRRSPALVSNARRVLDIPVTRSMLDVLHAESPSNYQLASLGIRAEDRAALQAKTEGYHMCLDFLEALGIAIEDDKPPLEATFEPAEPVNPT